MRLKVCIAAAAVAMFGGTALAQAPSRPQETVAGDVGRGASAYRSNCLSCHSLEPGRHMTGPSLGGLIGRPAGKAQGFDRYSEALASVGFDWTPERLDDWLANPSKTVPGSRMSFLVGDAQVRADLIAYFERLKSGDMTGVAVPRQQHVDLKTLGRASRLKNLKHCGETFTVELENGATLSVWERNLRLRVDSSGDGPEAGKPVLLPGGMQGDRSSVIFRTPSEISAFIAPGC